METVQQNGRFTLFSSKFPSNIYSILFVDKAIVNKHLLVNIDFTRPGISQTLKNNFSYCFD